MSSKKPLIEDRPWDFWSRLEIKSFDPDVCWEWCGGYFPDGYGYAYFNARDKRWRAHRLAYKLAYDKDPGNLCVCHKCDNPACCRPSHLFLGSHKDNMQDKVKKGLSLSGSKHPRAKLTEAQVKQIRKMVEQGIPQYILAKRFKVSQSTINAIIKKRNWATLE